MQGKGIIKFFFILLFVVSLFQYLIVLPTNRVEKVAKERAELASQGLEGAAKHAVMQEVESKYLDSMNNETIFSIPMITDYTYEDLKKQQLALGLDLKGGMSLVMQVDLKDMLLSLSEGSKDPTFLQAIDNAEERLKSDQKDFITLFGEEWNKIKGDQRLAQIFQRNASLRDDIDVSTSDGEVVRLLRTKADETVSLTFNRLQDRIDKFGVTQPNVSLDAPRDLILVELPGVTNEERAKSYLQAAAKLEFWDVYPFDATLQNALIEADQRLKRLQAGDTSSVTEPTIVYDTVPAYDSLGNILPDSFNISERELSPLEDLGPLLSKFDMNGQIQTENGVGLKYFPSVLGVADGNQKEAVMEMLQRTDIRALFPRDLKMLWAQKPYTLEGTNNEQFALYAIKMPRGTDQAPLEGDRVTDAYPTTDPTDNSVVVSLEMDAKGARTWGQMTTEAANANNRSIAIALDDEVVSAPSVNGPILGGRSSIEGGFTLQEATDLANILKVGKLPATPKIISSQVVGPSLGQENIRKSILSLVIGVSLLLLFMVFYYGKAGIVSIISLLLNLFFIFGALASLGTVLTLPGIAGIILTIGMAVDANVIIFERVREELRIGKTMSMAIKDGFKHSYSAIIDANVTTLLVAFVLAYFGIGPIKGFAVVLIIGVLASLFTAVLIGRLLIEWWIRKEGRTMSFWTPPTRNVLAHLEIDWLSKRKIGYIVSGIIILAGLVSMFTRGFDYGVDFNGGYSYNIEFDQEVNAQEVREALTAPFESEPVVKNVDALNTFQITTDYLINSSENDASEQVLTRLYEGINTIVGGDLDMEQFRSTDGLGTHITSSNTVGPTIADDITNSSVYATIFALLLIFLYIFIRFNKYQYSLGAVAALFHDTLIVLGLFSLLKGVLPFTIEIDQAFIAALLTVIGYSINDTVVVFDRIREYINTYTQKNKNEIINAAINSTVSRTIITSLTTLFVVIILLIFGGSTIKGFAFALLIGILVGTYSSIFIATPVMVDLTKELVKPEKRKTKRFSKAAKV